MATILSKILLVSTFYLLIMIGYSSFYTIVTKIREEDGDNALSPFSLLILNTTLLITNLFTSKVALS